MLLRPLVQTGMRSRGRVALEKAGPPSSGGGRRVLRTPEERKAHRMAKNRATAAASRYVLGIPCDADLVLPACLTHCISSSPAQCRGMLTLTCDVHACCCTPSPGSTSEPGVVRTQSSVTQGRENTCSCSHEHGCTCSALPDPIMQDGGCMHASWTGPSAQARVCCCSGSASRP